jgi:hypothetical protein
MRVRAREQDDGLCGQRQQNQRQPASPRERIDAHADCELDQQVTQRNRQVAPPSGKVESPDPEKEVQRAQQQQLRPPHVRHPRGPWCQRDQREVCRDDHREKRAIADDGIAAER